MDENKVERIASTIIAFEHRDEGELRRYFERHPHADKTKHWVKPTVEHDKEIKKVKKDESPMSDDMAKELTKRINQLKEKIETYETRAQEQSKEGNKAEAEKSEDMIRSYNEKLKKLKEKMKPYKEWLTRNKERK